MLRALRTNWPATLAVAFLLLLVAMNIAPSQEPAPRPREASQPPQTHTAQGGNSAQNELRGTDQSPLVVKVIPTPKTEAEAAQEAKDRDHKAANENLLTVFTGILALFTAILAIATVALVKATIRIYRHTATAERAYIELSHKTPPGFLVPTPVNGANTAEIKIKMKNRGHTPGRVVECFFTTVTVPHGQILASKGPPNYGTTMPFLINATLMPGGNVIWKTKQFAFNANMPDVLSAKLDLWVIGYADFEDTFGNWHRSGYARQYIPGIAAGGNNLGFGRERGHNNEWSIHKRPD